MFPKVLLLTAIIMEIILLVAILMMTTAASHSLQAFLLAVHFSLCVLYINGLEAVLPSQLCNRSVKEKSGLFLFAFFTPVLSQIAFVFMFMMMGRVENRHKNRLFRYGHLPELPMRSQFIKKGRQTGTPLTAINLEETLRAQDGLRVEERVRAITSIRYLNHHKAVLLLREALKDQADDVRLLSYAILSQREALIQQEITSLKSGLSHQQTHYKVNLLKRLAQLHWQLVDQSLLHDAQAKQSADQACQFANTALRQGFDPDMHRLLARYYLWREEPELARFHLLQPDNGEISDEPSSRVGGQFLQQEWGLLFMACRQLDTVAQMPAIFSLESTSFEDTSLESEDN